MAELGVWCLAIGTLASCAKPAPAVPTTPAVPAPAVSAPAVPVPGAKAPHPSVLDLGWPIWIGIICDDLPAQRRFYRDVLGLPESNVSIYSSWFQLDGKLLELLAKSAHPQYAQRGVSFGFA